MPLIETTNDAAPANSGTADANAAAVAPPVPAVEPPGLVDILDTMAGIIEHSGLHHSEKFGKFVTDVRAFQRSIAEKPTA